MTSAVAAGADVVRLATNAMGCRFELVIAGEPEPFARAAGELAIEAIRHAHASLTRFEHTSPIARINAGHTERCAPEVFELLELALQLEAETGRAFSPTHTSPGSLELNADIRAASLNADGSGGVGSLDLGGIGKGHAIDVAIQTLLDEGVVSAFIHAGTSTLAAIGTDPSGEPWRVRIAGELNGGADLDVIVSGRVLATSGDAVQPGHIRDPRTGAAAPAGGVTACLAPITLAGAGAICDAYSTALSVLRARPVQAEPNLTTAIESDAQWSVEGPLSHAATQATRTEP